MPWNLLLCAALGVWLMAAPAVLGATGAAANVDHLVGALIVGVAVMVLSIRRGRIQERFGEWNSYLVW